MEIRNWKDWKLEKLKIGNWKLKNIGNQKTWKNQKLKKLDIRKIGN